MHTISVLPVVQHHEVRAIGIVSPGIQVHKIFPIRRGLHYVHPPKWQCLLAGCAGSIYFQKKTREGRTAMLSDMFQVT